MEIQYKGYIGKIWYSADVRVFYGEVVNSKNFIGFQGESLIACQQIMEDMIEEVLKGFS